MSDAAPVTVMASVRELTCSVTLTVVVEPVAIVTGLTGRLEPGRLDEDVVLAGGQRRNQEVAVRSAAHRARARRWPCW